MRSSDDSRQCASVAGRGLGAGLVALLAAVGRQGDDVARFVGRHADDIGRGAIHQADDLSRFAIHGGDEMLRGADVAARPGTLPESPGTMRRPAVVSTRVSETSADRGTDDLWHLAEHTGEEALELVIEYVSEDE